MAKFGKLSINRSTGFGTIYTFWQVVASIGDQLINKTCRGELRIKDKYDKAF